MCPIRILTDPVSGETRLNGYVRISPARAGLAAIEKLRRMTLMGEPIAAQRHFHGAEFDIDGALMTGSEHEHRSELTFDLVDD
ncbi:MAG: hypothetical protein LJE69_19940 [Thiohalocapsa sp.]|jgi:hypothetical protein|uniref:hypothetical protein n=1 Tax=Thiohalocapsa sp. TaxID=2497641 RepID=UPI0025D2B5C6|nr:hypothetical protein [Thiohalocapsa sp.]MCG6943509.1 hypothetical protein [Thiohalocapsa sp.]